MARTSAAMTTNLVSSLEHRISRVQTEPKLASAEVFGRHIPVHDDMRGNRMHVAPATLYGIPIHQPARSADLDQRVHGLAQHLHAVGEVPAQQGSCLHRHARVVLAGKSKRPP